MASYRVEPYAGGRWGVRREGADEPFEVYGAQEAAAVRAELLARMTGGGEVVVVDEHGGVRDRVTVSPAGER